MFPGIVHVLAVQARSRRALSAPAIDCAGRWLSIAASPLDGGEDGTVAVLVQPCTDDGPLEVILRTVSQRANAKSLRSPFVEGPAKEIAKRLYLSPLTVEDHLRSAYRKTGTSGRARLAELAYG